MSNIVAIFVQGDWPMDETQTAPSRLDSFRDTNSNNTIYSLNSNVKILESGSPVLDELFASPALSLIKITVVLRGLPLQINNICSVYVPNSSGLTVRSVGRAVMDTIERVEGESCFQIFLRVW
ncbi:hypothetical protein SLS56_008855 [Neofusicoccum ribis]|uniref:Uncharacterized protein n=1 Tax=Neofusicoccum ribis TaxID=45134 RepID=A0ABR3SIX0_9PEZI